jgi:Fe-S-cluster-containing hydrogenase component 2
MTNTLTIAFQKSGVIAFDAELCVGCGSCMLMCSFYQEDVVSPSLSRIRIDRDPLNAEYRANICQQCLAPSCYVVCPVIDEALCIDEVTGARYVDPDYCTACDECVYACPFEPKHVRVHPHTSKAYKCDLCFGREEGPICVEYCPVDALEFVHAGER